MYITVKESLLAACRQYVGQRMANAQQAIASANDAVMSDTKSSAGDKFETTREMMQQEIGRNQQLLVDAQRMEQVLSTMDMRPHKGPSRQGSIVVTNRGTFFLAISIGRLTVAGESYWVVSIASPIGQLLVGQEAGQAFAFNGVQYVIDRVM